MLLYRVYEDSKIGAVASLQTLLCGSFLSSTLQSPKRKQVIISKELQKSLQEGTTGSTLDIHPCRLEPQSRWSAY